MDEAEQRLARGHVASEDGPRIHRASVNDVPARGSLALALCCAVWTRSVLSVRLSWHIKPLFTHHSAVTRPAGLARIERRRACELFRDCYALVRVRRTWYRRKSEMINKMVLGLYVLTLDL